MRRTQIFMASTLYGAATLAAALDAGRFTPAERRLLLVSNNAAVPETTPALDTMPGFEVLRGRFDGVLSWNEAIAPLHPGGWSPRNEDVPLWERNLRRLWDLGEDEVQLVVESIQVEPALALVNVFPSAQVEVYADGLMSYGPTRNKLEPLITTRISRLLHLDLVPGLRPLLLSEYGVGAEVVPAGAFTKVLAEMAEASEPGADLAGLPADAALLLGQYLSALDILNAAEEEELHLTMLRGAVALGHRDVVFKPHPSAPAHWSRRLEEEADALGAKLTVLDSPVLAEVLYERLRPAIVIGCFSTALLTASAFYGIPVARTGTGLLLDRLSPYQNSNRIPVTLVDALIPDVADPAAAASAVPPDLNPLLRAVGYCMQSHSYPHLRDEAVAFLAASLDNDSWRYFKRRRLTALALPGAVPAPLAFIPRSPAVRRVARRAMALKRAALG
ncbi:polysialyltransferase family glycosyltransferase [Actinacidiphila soli]|uniref:polysialyltransferase family glycosyltransferase n=1 Tax=Actinacidiphila soli TaxID=2487275 RepID=UPI000FCC7F21|nr:polysialyltransferase family glycosyltransferase [Actinacidiphila soli]